MPKNLERLSPVQGGRSWLFYAGWTFVVTLLVAAAVYLVLARHRSAGGYVTRLDGTPAPATFDGIGWKIEAEDYDPGGEGVGYHDSFPGNILYQFNPSQKRPGEYRDDDVEIMTKNPGQRVVGFVLQGEWLAYTVDVPETGKYDLDLNVAAMHPDRRIHFELDGRRLPETVILPVTGDWATFEVVTMPGDVHLTRGRHRLRMVFDEPFMNVDWLRFTPRGTPGSGAPIR